MSLFGMFFWTQTYSIQSMSEMIMLRFMAKGKNSWKTGPMDEGVSDHRVREQDKRRRQSGRRREFWNT